MSLAAGASVSFSVQFAPTAAGAVSGSVTVTSNTPNSPTMIALSGTGTAAVTHSVTLSWVASTSTVVGYNVYRGSVSGGPYTMLNSTPNAAVSYTDMAVTAGQTYYYVVTAVDASGNESVVSNEVAVIIPKKADGDGEARLPGGEEILSARQSLFSMFLRASDCAACSGS